MTLGDSDHVHLLHGADGDAGVQIASIGTQISEAFAGLDRIREIRDMPPEDAEEADARAARATCAATSCSTTSWFEYNAGVPVLKDIVFHAPAGSTTALVGLSGSGKSTLHQPRDGLQPARQGPRPVDGRDLADAEVADYRWHLGVVLQDNFLFDGTIADNIAYSQAARDARRDRGGQPDRALRRVHRAVQSWATTRWWASGGRACRRQRQRVAIRAILRRGNPQCCSWRRGDVEPRQRERER